LVHHTHILDSGEVLVSILLRVVLDFEQSQKPGWETTLGLTIHILIRCLYPNTIITTRMVTEEPRSSASSRVYLVNIRFLEFEYREFEFHQVFNWQCSQDVCVF